MLTLTFLCKLLSEDREQRDYVKTRKNTETKKYVDNVIRMITV